MAQNTATADGGSNFDHPAADLETVVVNADDVVEAMRRAARDRDEQLSHVLRVSPPLQGEQTATPHVSEAHTYYPPELSQKPIHIGPATFLVGHSPGVRHPDYRAEWSYPDISEERALFRDEFDIAEEDRPISDELEEEWEEWWNTVVEIWEGRVRHALKNTDEITLGDHLPDTDDTIVAVKFEGDQ